MSRSLKDSLQFSKYCLDTRLIAIDSLHQINHIASLLPEIPTVSQVIFECRLGSSEAQSDFAIAFTTSNNGREALVNCHDPLTRLLHTNSVWNRIGNFCDRWSNKNSQIYKNVSNIWLEFDLIDNFFFKEPEPSFFFSYNDIFQEKTTFDQNDISWITDEVFQLLFDNCLSKEVKKQFLTCFESLPPGGKIYQIGAMLPRKTESQAIRLCVKNLNKQQILEYLKNIGWSFSFKELEILLSEMYNYVDDIALSFSIQDTVIPKIGFECYCSKPSISGKWKLFLDYLVKHQLCIVEKADTLLKLPKCLEQENYPEQWPRNLADTSAFLSPAVKSTFVCYLNHIKLVYQPNQPLQAKAYLSFHHLWYSPRGFFKG